MSYLIGVDIGTSGTKTITYEFGEQARLWRAQWRITRSIHRRPMWSEQDPSRLVERHMLNYPRRSAFIRDRSGRQVKAAGLSGQMHGSVFVDEH